MLGMSQRLLQFLGRHQVQRGPVVREHLLPRAGISRGDVRLMRRPAVHEGPRDDLDARPWLQHHGHVGGHAEVRRPIPLDVAVLALRSASFFASNGGPPSVQHLGLGLIHEPKVDGGGGTAVEVEASTLRGGRLRRERRGLVARGRLANAEGRPHGLLAAAARAAGLGAARLGVRGAAGLGGEHGAAQGHPVSGDGIVEGVRVDHGALPPAPLILLRVPIRGLPPILLRLLPQLLCLCRARRICRHDGLFLHERDDLARELVSGLRRGRILDPILRHALASETVEIHNHKSGVMRHNRPDLGFAALAAILDAIAPDVQARLHHERAVLPARRLRPVSPARVHVDGEPLICAVGCSPQAHVPHRGHRARRRQVPMHQDLPSADALHNRRSWLLELPFFHVAQHRVKRRQRNLLGKPPRQVDGHRHGRHLLLAREVTFVVEPVVVLLIPSLGLGIRGRRERGRRLRTLYFELFCRLRRLGRLGLLTLALCPLGLNQIPEVGGLPRPHRRSEEFPLVGRLQPLPRPPVVLGLQQFVLPRLLLLPDPLLLFIASLLRLRDILLAPLLALLQLIHVHGGLGLVEPQVGGLRARLLARLNDDVLQGHQYRQRLCKIRLLVLLGEPRRLRRQRRRRPILGRDVAPRRRALRRQLRRRLLHL
mmetsp:Transcript_93620/g.303026  ORF Transcript_93620/g.303026 Transcript_93620/m.303026 type:complete len:654 (+) Transcript_93620:4681-6642(+)